MDTKLIIPQQQHTPLITGASSPQQSAVMKINNMNEMQSALNKIGGRYKKYKKYKGGVGGTIEIPPTSITSYNVNGLVGTSVGANLIGQANSEFDKGAFIKGGSKRRRTIHKTKRRSTKSKKRRHRTRRYRR